MRRCAAICRRAFLNASRNHEVSSAYATHAGPSLPGFSLAVTSDSRPPWCGNQARPYSANDISPGPGPASAQREAVEKMVDMMVHNKALQQMMMAALPPAMRRPEVLQSLFSNPATRAQVVDMISKQGMVLPPEVLQRLSNTSDLESSLAQAEQMGLSPQDMFKKLLQYPLLMQKFQDPRVVRAFLDIAQNPDNLHKYSDQPDIVEVYFKAKEVLLPQKEKPFSQPPPQLDPSSSPPSSSEASLPQAFSIPLPPQAASSSQPEAPELPSGAGGMLGIGSDEVLQRLLSNPAAVAALSKPKVQEALRESAGSKWKMLKYMFDPDVREAVKEIQKLVDGPSKPPK